jgi:hypothetical protein
MKWSTCAAALAIAAPAMAAPVEKRADTITDGEQAVNPAALKLSLTIYEADVLNYALTLEHLEDKFYREGLQKFHQSDFAAAGFDQTFYQNLEEVSFDETTHVSFLTSALKGETLYKS